MSVIVFATGGTTSNARTIEHPWENYEFVISKAAQALSPLFRELKVYSVANCLTAGNLWGGFLFAHEICRQLRVRYYPFASIVDCDALCEVVGTDAIDTIICLPSFAERLLVPERKAQLASVKNIFYLGEMFPDTLIAKAQRLLPGVCIKPLAYTSQETGPIGFQCMHLSGNHYHIYKHVDLVRKQLSGEFSVTINYPGQSHLLDHSMGDVGDIHKGNTCPCGYLGDSLNLQGRVPTSRNILGTSISIYEFARTLSEISTEPLTDTDLQLVEVENQEQGLGLVLMVCSRSRIASDQISDRLKSSSLIKELISDALYFHVYIADKRAFMKSETTQKIKPFIRTRLPPADESVTCLVIK